MYEKAGPNPSDGTFITERPSMLNDCSGLLGMTVTVLKSYPLRDVVTFAWPLFWPGHCPAGLAA
jgi:hypothetical protein